MESKPFVVSTTPPQVMIHVMYVGSFTNTAKEYNLKAVNAFVYDVAEVICV